MNTNGRTSGTLGSGTICGKNTGILPPHVGYRNLLSFQRAEVVYDATVRFCADFFDKRDRTVDQMVPDVLKIARRKSGPTLSLA